MLPEIIACRLKIQMYVCLRAGTARVQQARGNNKEQTKQRTIGSNKNTTQGSKVKQSKNKSTMWGLCAFLGFRFFRFY
jgi:hypothetical protein